MTRRTEIIATTAAAGLLYVPVVLLLVPPPIPSLTALIGGLVASWLSRSRRVVHVYAGALCGLAAGVLLHARSHIVEGRADPLGEFALHVMEDAGVGLLIAGVILGVTLVLRAKFAMGGS